jgi:NTE family protein
LSDELLERLAGQINAVHVCVGTWIMREVEPADSMFIVRSGRLEVIEEGPPQALLRVLRLGDVLGELALLRDETRSASVQAPRDIELVELGRAGFQTLVKEAPSFAVSLMQAVGARLAANRASVAAATPPKTIAAVALDPAAPTAQVAETLADGLMDWKAFLRVVELGRRAVRQALEADPELLSRLGS